VNVQLGELVAATRGGRVVFSLSGEFDLSNAWKIRDALLTAVDDRHVREIVVDLRAVRFMDAQLLRSLVRARSAARGRGLTIAIVPPSDPDVWRVAQLVDFPVAA
jgi:anti-anti-sigma factor